MPNNSADISVPPISPVTDILKTVKSARHLPDAQIYQNFRFKAEQCGNSVTRFIIEHNNPPKESHLSSFLQWQFIIPFLIAYVGHPSISLSMLLFWFLFFKPSKSALIESLELIDSVGIQVSTTFSDGTRDVILIPESEISEIIVNEAAAGFRIRTFIAIVKKRSCSCENLEIVDTATTSQSKTSSIAPCNSCIRDACVLPFEHTELPIVLAAEILFSINKWDPVDQVGA